MGLVFSISNSLIAKTSLANNWRSFSSSYSALVGLIIVYAQLVQSKRPCEVLIISAQRFQKTSEVFSINLTRAVVGGIQTRL